MEVTLGLVADLANISQEGKLNILGIFDTIYAFNFPCKHTQMTLITKIRAGLNDAHHIDRKITIVLVDEDLNATFSIDGKFNFKNTPEGERGTTSSIIVITDLLFKNPGNYFFKISIDGEEKAEIPLKIMKLHEKV